MVVSARAILAMGLGVVGLGLLAGPTFGQQPDGAVRKSAAQATPAPVKPPDPATFGTIDMAAVFKGYDKVKTSSEEFKSAVMSKKNELMKLMSEAQQQSEMLAKMTPGSLDSKKYEDKISQLKAQHEALREQYERDFSLREAEMLATLYKEIQAMVSRVAQFRKMTYILRVSNDPVSGSNPNSAMMAIERTVVYAETRNDITEDVVKYLNMQYKAAAGTSPGATSSTAPAATGLKASGN